jgi:ribosomal protein L11 methyltransferase
VPVPIFSVHVEAPAEREDELVARLWALGCQGSWSEPSAVAGRTRLHAFFAADELPDAARLAAALAAGGDVELSAAEPVAERDWQEEWRAAAQPIAVAGRFLVDPREPAAGSVPPAAPGRWLLRLPARTAFGVGSHESTALAVELLESLPLAGRRVLDVGTGTGILAFAALRLGARSALALDVDPAAALLLPAMQALNATPFAAFAGTLQALGPAAERRFDVALVNVVPSEIAGDLPRLAAVLAPGAVAVFSGILRSEGAAAVAALAAHGFVERSRRISGEWLAFAAEGAA